MVYRFLVINHKSLADRGVMERCQILERRRGSELDLYTSRRGPSTCVVGGLAAEVRENKGVNIVCRNERKIGQSMRRIRFVIKLSSKLMIRDYVGREIRPGAPLSSGESWWRRPRCPCTLMQRRGRNFTFLFGI